MYNINHIAEDVPESISAMSDSVNAISMQIAKEYPNADYDAIRKNYQHLEIMLNKDFIANSGQDLSEFSQVILSAKTFLGD